MPTVEPLSRAPLFALFTVALPLFFACSDVTIVAGGGGSGGQGNQGQGGVGGSDSPAAVPCEQRQEAECVGDCVALVDWTPLSPGAPPPPPDVVLDAGPCCPECAQEQCNGCHRPAFKRCTPLDQCAEPQPAEDCGVPLSCDP